jgi:transposase, IS5 family
LQEKGKNIKKACKMSKPQTIETRQDDLFRSRLSTQLNPKHPLFILTGLIDWKSLEAYFEPLYQAELGHPPRPIRLMVGLTMLQHMEGLSDEQIVEKWVENPYFQYFCGYDHFQWQMPIDPSSLTRWRQRIGEKGMERILSESIKTAIHSGAVCQASLKQTIADTTVQEKAITHPTDSKLLNRARQKLVSLAKKHGISLRQSYTRVGRQAFGQACRYGHAGQYKRMDKQIKKLKTYLGRVMRDIQRKLPDGQQHLFETMLEMAQKLLLQTKTSSDKLYSLHAPEVECIAKGKAHKRYEFGCKVSLVVTHKEGLVLSSRALHGNPYDGHTLKESLENAEALSGETIEEVFVDKAYKKHGIEGKKIFMSGQRKLSPSLKKALKRRNAIEPHIGHMKAEAKLGRNYLKGETGDKFNALLVGIGHNLRLILNYLRILFALIREFIFSPWHLYINRNSSIPGLGSF